MMVSCEQVLQTVYEFIDKEMTRDGMVTIKAHLDLCRSCFSRVEFEKLLREHMKSTTDHACPEKVKKKIQDLMQNF